MGHFLGSKAIAQLTYLDIRCTVTEQPTLVSECYNQVQIELPLI